jgi:hypothetical protein
MLTVLNTVTPSPQLIASLLLSHLLWGTWSKNYWTDFLESNFFGSEKFQYDPFSNLKDISQWSIHKFIVGPVKNGVFNFWIFFNKI